MMQVQKPKQGYNLVITNLRHSEQIPDDWKIIPLRNLIIEIKTGFAEGERDDNGLIQLRMNNISDEGTLNFDKTLKVPIPDDIDEYDLKKNDVLFNNTNSLDLIGKSTIVQQNFDYTFSNHITRIRTNQEKLVSYFLLLILLKYKKEALFRSICNTHVGQSGIGKNELLNVKIIHPPLKEQQKIASILSNVDSLIQQTQKEIEQTQRLKKGLMQRLLTKGIGHKKFKKTELGEIPEKWKIIRLEEACLKSKHSFSMGPFGSDIKTDNFVPSGVPVIRGINLTKQPFYEEGFVFVSENKADELRAANAFSGDLIFTHRGTLGQVAVIPFNSKFKRYVISQSQMKCTCDTSLLDPMFVFYFFISDPGQKIMMTHSTKSGVPHIVQPLTSLRSFLIPLPEIMEQKKIIGIISGVNSLVEKRQEYKSKLENLKKGLMQKLLTGQIRVKV